MKRTDKGFTLIEMLTVIAIIAVLAGMLFPVFARSRDLAYQTQCINNLSQIGRAIELYQQDNDDRFPLALDFTDEVLDWSGWDRYYPDVVQKVRMLQARRDPIDGDLHGGRLEHVLRSILPNQDVWRCPGDTGFGGVGYAASELPFILVNRPPYVPVWQQSRNYGGRGKWGGISYMYRSELGFANKGADRLRDPVNTNVVSDATHYWHHRLHRVPIYSPSGTNTDLADVRQGSYNVLFADGHVKTVLWDDYVDAWVKWEIVDGQYTWRLWK